VKINLGMVHIISEFVFTLIYFTAIEINVLLIKAIILDANIFKRTRRQEALQEN
jgi:hypothetical protein